MAHGPHGRDVPAIPCSAGGAHARAPGAPHHADNDGRTGSGRTRCVGVRPPCGKAIHMLDESLNGFLRRASHTTPSNADGPRKGRANSGAANMVAKSARGN